LATYAAHQRARRWVSGRMTPVDGRTLAIVGLGKTGQTVARYAKGLDLHVLGVPARPQSTPFVDEVVGQAALAAVLPRADAVVLCLPLTAATRGLFDQRAFAAMKDGALLVDVSRGGIVDTQALIEALQSKKLKGAALDVFEQEPLPEDRPLRAFDNAIITPHCSSVYHGWERDAAQMFADNLERYRHGEPLQNVVDPARGH
jgi:phosphoglycerate dehydrogenase-like enzyme